MDLEGLVRVLKLSMTLTRLERKNAEEQLVQLAQVQGFVVALMQLIVRTDVELSVRQMASIQFKNVVAKRWRPKESGLPLAEEDKKLVRENLVEAIICAPVPIRSQLVECLKTAIGADFPDNWPSLVPSIDANLKSNDQQRTYGALVALRLLTRKYEYKDEEERVAILPVINAIFPHLLSIFKYLLSLPSASTEIADLIKLVCKTFWSATFLSIPPPLMEEAIFLEWAACFHALLERPVPVEGQPAELADRPHWPWWKVKKWVLHIANRLYNRFGDPSVCKGQQKSFALMFQHHCTGRFLAGYLALLAPLRHRGYLPDRIINLALSYITLCVVKKEAYKQLKAHVGEVLYEVALPLLCHTDEDDRLWRDDPHEYVRKGYDIMEDMYSARTAAVNFVVELADKRSKEHLAPLLQTLMATFQRYADAPLEMRPWREKDGALLAVGALADKLKSKAPYNAQLEPLLLRHVLPDLQAPVGHIRAKAAWVVGQYADIPFSDPRSFSTALNLLTGALRDPDLPVRVDSVVALRSLVEAADDLSELRALLPRLLDDFFKLMNEVENEDLVFTLETIVDRFGEEMAPYAIGLIQNLTAAFWRCLESSEEDEDDDSGALAAVGCLRAIGTILESISALPQMFSQVEPTLLPVLHKMISSDGQDVFEEVLEIASYLTYFSPSITPQMWSIWPLIMTAVDEWAVDFLGNALGPLDNFISRGSETFLTCPDPNYPESLYKMVSKVLSDKNLDDREVQPAPKLLESVLHNCRGRVDQWVEPYLRLVVERLRNSDGNHLKDLLINVVADALYYNAELALSILQGLGVTAEVFQLWFSLLHKKHSTGKPTHFRRLHDKKMGILGLASLLVVPAGKLPAGVLAALPQLMRVLLDLLVAYKEQEAVAKAAGSDSEDDDEEVEEEEENEEEDDNEDEDNQLEAAASGGVQSDGTTGNAELDKLTQSWRSQEGEYLDGSESDFTDDEEFQTPLDKVDPFVFFADVMAAVKHQETDKFQALLANLDFRYQAAAHGISQLAEERRQLAEKERMEAAVAAAQAEQALHSHQ